MTFLLFKLQTIYCKYAILQQQKIWCAFSYFHVSFTKCPLDPHVVDKIDEEADQEEGKRKFHLTTAIQQQKETLKRLKEQTNWCFPCKNEEKKKEISHKSSQLNQVCRLVFQYISFFLSLSLSLFVLPFSTIVFMLPELSFYSDHKIKEKPWKSRHSNIRRLNQKENHRGSQAMKLKSL